MSKDIDTDFFDLNIVEEYDEIQSYKALKYFIRRDLEQTSSIVNLQRFLSFFLFVPGYKFVVWLRITRYFFLKTKLFFPLFIISRLRLKHFSYKYGFDISYRTRIGPGLSISHFGSIVIAAQKIGSNCSIRPGVVIGKNLINKGRTPIIGDNVHFGVGSKVIGEITIDNNVVIGANSVVTKNIESNSVVVGSPGKVIKHLDKIVELELN